MLFKLPSQISFNINYIDETFRFSEIINRKDLNEKLTLKSKIIHKGFYGETYPADVTKSPHFLREMQKYNALIRKMEYVLIDKIKNNNFDNEIKNLFDCSYYFELSNTLFFIFDDNDTN